MLGHYLGECAGTEQNCVMNSTKNVTVQLHTVSIPYLVPTMNMHHNYKYQVASGECNFQKLIL